MRLLILVKLLDGGIYSPEAAGLLFVVSVGVLGWVAWLFLRDRDRDP